MSVGSVQARADAFYRNLPGEVRDTLARDQWISIALFIEENLPSWPKETRSIFRKDDTGLARTIKYYPHSERVYVELSVTQDREMTSSNEMLEYDVLKPKILRCILPKELQALLHYSNWVDRPQFHGDIKPENQIFTLSRPPQFALTDFDYSYSPQDIKDQYPRY